MLEFVGLVHFLHFRLAFQAGATELGLTEEWLSLCGGSFEVPRSACSAEEREAERVQTAAQPPPLPRADCKPGGA